jgi:outer membrane protein TolC
VSKTARTLAAAGFIFASALPALAQQKPQEPSKEHVQALIAQAMQQTGQTPAPAQAQPFELPVGPVVNLTEEEAVTRARDRNLTLVSERITPQTWDYTMAATRANYQLNLTSSFQNQSQVRVTTDVFSGGDRVTTDSQNWSAGIAKNMWRGGGSYSVSWTNGRTSSDSQSSTFNPSYNSGIAGRFTQPLLRNFKIDSTRAQILTNEVNQQIADINLTSQEVSILVQVRNAYWELVYAGQAVEAAERSLELATKLVGDNRARVEIGTMAPIDVVQAQAEAATRRQQLVNAQATLRNNELALKRLIVSGTDDELWRATIKPVDRPTVTAQPIDLEGAVRNALSRRTDLTITKKNLELADISLRAQRNQTLPDLQLIGNYNLAGQGGTQIERDRITGGIINTFPGGYFDALSALGGWDAPTWNVQVQFAYPIGTSVQEANLARQQLLRRQTETTIKATELQVATEVTAAALAVRNTLEAMQASTVSRQLAEERLQATQSKFDVGMSTNFEVVQAQRDLNDARNSELRAQLNYQRALVDFQRVQITR